MLQAAVREVLREESRHWGQFMRLAWCEGKCCLLLLLPRWSVMWVESGLLVTGFQLATSWQVTQTQHSHFREVFLAEQEPKQNVSQQSGRAGRWLRVLQSHRVQERDQDREGVPGKSSPPGTVIYHILVSMWVLHLAWPEWATWLKILKTDPRIWRFLFTSSTPGYWLKGLW